MICNCESGYCSHHHGDPSDILDVKPCPNEADGTARMILVGVVCDACASTADEFGNNLIARTT